MFVDEISFFGRLESVALDHLLQFIKTATGTIDPQFDLHDLRKLLKEISQNWDKPGSLNLSSKAPNTTILSSQFLGFREILNHYHHKSKKFLVPV